MSGEIISGIFLFGFLIILLALGFYFRKKANTSRGFLTGDAQLGPILAAGMFAATFLSSSSSVGFTGFLYASGWEGFTSILADRYQSKGIRGLSAVAMVFLYVIFTAAELIGLGKTLQVFLGWEYHIAVLISAIFTVAFVLLGGMFAVAINDTICGFLGIGGLVVLAVVCLFNQGGLSQMNANMAAVDPALLTTFTDASGVLSVTAIIACVSNAAVWGIGNSSHPVFLAQTFSTISCTDLLHKKPAVRLEEHGHQLCGNFSVLFFYYDYGRYGASFVSWSDRHRPSIWSFEPKNVGTSWCSNPADSSSGAGNFYNRLLLADSWRGVWQ